MKKSTPISRSGRHEGGKAMLPGRRGAGSGVSGWEVWRRADQAAPRADFTTWLILGGRGAGKTRAGAEWVLAQVRAGARRVALVGETYADAREVMVDGESGLRQIARPGERPVFLSSRHLLLWPNGAQARLFSADDPDGLRGYQHDAAWSDELAKWKRLEAAWSNLQFGLRLGRRPRQMVTTTPRPLPLLKRLMETPGTIVTRAPTFANKGMLAPSFLAEVTRTYQGTALGRQELLGEIVEDRAGALWSWPLIEAAQVSAAPALSRIVVAIDPPVTSGPQADECGLIVAGAAGEGPARRAYLLKDASVQGLSPAAWGERAAALFEDFAADRIVAEVNQGGDLVTEILRQARPGIAVTTVRAMRGKILRAEPVAALYERGLVRHVGVFPELEAQMTGFTGTPGEASPDRLDALVWALTALMLGGGPAIPKIHSV